MAGIGFNLQKMIQGDRLGTNLHGLMHATMIAAGPWLLTCLALGLLPALAAHGGLDHDALLRFHGTAVLAFSVSMVVAGPYAMVLSRSLADAVHSGDVRAVPSMLSTTLARVFTWLAPIGLLLFGVVVDLPAGDRMAGFLLLLACGGVWIVTAMLAALRMHAVVALAFGVGLLLALLIGQATLGRWHEAGLLTGLVIGQSVTLVMLVARVLNEFPSAAAATRREPAADFELDRATEQFRDLAWVGFLYNAALWADKWLMWLAPGAERAGRAVWSNPGYETAMFLAFLTVAPVIAIFLVDVETRFHRTYLRWFQAIDRRATLRGIRRNHGVILRITTSSFQRLILVQAAITVVAVVMSPAIAAWVGGGEPVAAMFRFGAFGAAFHAMFILAMTVLAYFDQRRWLLTVAAAFLAGNVLLTLVGLSMGSGWQGWGYAAAAVGVFGLTYYAAARSVTKLPFMTFVGANPTVRERPEAPDDEATSPLSNTRRPGSVLVGGALNQTL